MYWTSHFRGGTRFLYLFANFGFFFVSALFNFHKLLAENIWVDRLLGRISKYTTPFFVIPPNWHDFFSFNVFFSSPVIISFKKGTMHYVWNMYRKYWSVVLQWIIFNLSQSYMTIRFNYEFHFVFINLRRSTRKWSYLS